MAIATTELAQETGPSPSPNGLPGIAPAAGGAGAPGVRKQVTPALAARRRAFAAFLNAGNRGQPAATAPAATSAAAAIAAAIAALAPQGSAEAAPSAQGSTPPPSGISTPLSPVMRMQNDLKRALAKPMEDRRWVMVIDQAKCVGCSACTIACVAENKLPPGVVYRPVLEEEIGTYPNVSRRFTPRPCMQCDEPPCVDVCPVNATYKRADGVVAINYEECIGCRYCIAACPYNARVFDSGEFWTANTPQPVQAYEQLPSYEYGVKRARVINSDASPIGNARKCQFCLHRVEAGMLPACVTTCIGYATYFGDASDPDSLVAELARSPRVQHLKAELGTKPRVLYLA